MEQALWTCWTRRCQSSRYGGVGVTRVTYELWQEPDSDFAQLFRTTTSEDDDWPGPVLPS